MAARGQLPPLTLPAALSTLWRMFRAAHAGEVLAAIQSKDAEYQEAEAHVAAACAGDAEVMSALRARHAADFLVELLQRPPPAAHASWLPDRVWLRRMVKRLAVVPDDGGGFEAAARAGAVEWETHLALMRAGAAAEEQGKAQAAAGGGVTQEGAAPSHR